MKLKHRIRGVGECSPRSGGLCQDTALESYGTVTRNSCPSGRNFPFFIDWMTIQQTHFDMKLPIISDGFVECFTAEGVSDWFVLKKKSIEGSFSSKIQLRCDGNTIVLSGNIGRFNRVDNLFGYDLEHCISKANEILALYDLPPFTKGVPHFMHNSTSLSFTGASISRIDLTANYATGSQEDAKAFVRWLSTQQDNRIKTGVYGEGQTVDFGRGSKRIYHKVYNKYMEMQRHKSEFIKPELLNYVHDNGIIRHEITLKSRYLRDAGINFIGSMDMKSLNIIYEERSEILKRADSTTDDYSKLPDYLRLTLRDYMAGDSFQGKKTKFYKHRKELLPLGIDISIPYNVVQFSPRIRVIKLESLHAPDWYWDYSLSA